MPGALCLFKRFKSLQLTALKESVGYRLCMVRPLGHKTWAHLRMLGPMSSVNSAQLELGMGDFYLHHHFFLNCSQKRPRKVLSSGEKRAFLKESSLPQKSRAHSLTSSAAQMLCDLRLAHASSGFCPREQYVGGL